MKQTVETLQERFRELNNDPARVSRILAERPDCLEELRPTLHAVKP